MCDHVGVQRPVIGHLSHSRDNHIIGFTHSSFFSVLLLFVQPIKHTVDFSRTKEVLKDFVTSKFVFGNKTS